MKQRDWLIRVVKGIIIALGFILPGASGSLLAAILGVYERLLQFIAHITTNFKENFLFFFPIGIGGILGIAILSRPLEFLLEHFLIIVLWTFAGLIVGTLPSLNQTAMLKSKRDKQDIIFFVIGLFFSFLLLTLITHYAGELPATFIGFIIAGIILGIGILLPGLSPSNILLILGIYSAMLTGFKDLDVVRIDELFDNLY